MKGLFGFLASGAGRLVRALAGVVLILAGLLAIGGTTGYIVAIIGLVPLLAGLFDRCVFALLAGLPFNGPEGGYHQEIESGLQARCLQTGLLSIRRPCFY